ncbi:hypothetical protein Tco_1428848 [Tanacetum coccineum]
MVSSHPVFPPLTGCGRLVSEPVHDALRVFSGNVASSEDVYPVFVDLESSTQADGAQSSRVSVPLPEDPYEAIRQAYLVGMDTESEPFEDLGTESPELPHTIASPISFLDSTPLACHVDESECDNREGADTSGAGSTSSDSTTPLLPDHPLTHDTPILVPSLRRTARMAVRVQPTMSPSCFARIAEVAAMSDVAFRKSEDDANEDEGDESLDEGDESHELDDESQAAPEGQQQAASVVETAGSGSAPEPERPVRVSAFRQPTFTTWTDPEDGTVFIDVPTYSSPAPPVQTPPSPEWSSGSLPISLTHSTVPSPISSPMIPLTIPSHVATPTATILVDKDQFIKARAGIGGMGRACRHPDGRYVTDGERDSREQ